MIRYHSLVTSKESDTGRSYSRDAAVLRVEERGDRIRLRQLNLSTVNPKVQLFDGFHTISFTKSRTKVYVSKYNEEKPVTALETPPDNLCHILNTISGGDRLTTDSYYLPEYYAKDNANLFCKLMVEAAVSQRITPKFPHKHYLEGKEPPKFPLLSRYSKGQTKSLGPPIILLMLLYPAFGEIVGGAEAYVELPYNFSTKSKVFEGLKKDTIEEFVEVLFPGKSTRYTRRLVVESLFPMAGVWDPSAICFLDLISGESNKLLIDHLHTLLKKRTSKFKLDQHSYTSGDINRDHKKGLGILASSISPYKLCSLMEEWQESAEVMFLDSLRMIGQLGDEFKIEGRLRGVDDLHNKVMYKELERTFTSKSISLPREVLDLNGTQINGMTLMVPKETIQLAIWSRKMSNCIRSYAADAVAHRYLLLGLYRGDNVVYNASVELGYNNGALRISQFYGPRNSQPDPQDLAAFQTWVVDNTPTIRLALQRR